MVYLNQFKNRDHQFQFNRLKQKYIFILLWSLTEEMGVRRRRDK